MTTYLNLRQLIKSVAVTLLCLLPIFQVGATQLMPIRTAPSGANLLFSSGFESATTIGAPNSFSFNSPYTNAWQDISGVDGSTGSTWPINIFSGGSTNRFQHIVSTNVDATTIGNYQLNQIQTVTGHTGSSTQALYQEILQCGANGTNPMGSFVDQNVFLLLPSGIPGDFYIRYWIKYQPNLVTLLNYPASNWRLLFEWKTGSPGGSDDGDYRVSISLVTWSITAPLSWHITGDNVASPAGAGGGLVTYWEVYSDTTSQVVGDWIKFEIFTHRSTGSDGRVWVAIDGVVILDRLGSNKITNSVNRIFMPNLYTSTAFPAYHWIDDVQIWDGFPSDATSH